MPKPPIDRQQVDRIGRAAGTAVVRTATMVARTVTAVARYAAQALTQIWRAFDAVPPALKVMFVAGVVMLAGIVGTLALTGPASLLCAVLVVPVASVTLGALGYRWMAEPGAAAENRATTVGAPATDLSRSVLYVDKKLTLALNALGSDRHQQAVIALFQAKTAVDLALGNEQDEDDTDDAPVHVDAYRLRPRIQPGPGSKSAIAESNSLAAS